MQEGLLGKNNPADMMTKEVGSETMQQHMKFMSFRCTAGRAEEDSILVNSIAPSLLHASSQAGGAQLSMAVTRMQRIWNQRACNGGAWADAQ